MNSKRKWDEEGEEKKEKRRRRRRARSEASRKEMKTELKWVYKSCLKDVHAIFH